MPKFTAVMGKSKSNRIVTVEADSKGEARVEVDRQLQLNPQRREILKQWKADGEQMVTDSDTTTDELVAMIESAREQIAEAAETLRAVANETDDIYRATTMLACLDVLVGHGGWLGLKSETLDGWIEELTTGQEV